MLANYLLWLISQVAPPATAIQDFEYKWKILKSFYARIDDHKRGHIADTNVPHHLMEMLQIILSEDQSEVNEKECLKFLLDNHCLNLMAEIALSDFPPGIRGVVLTWVRKFVSNLRIPPLMNPSIYSPIVKLLEYVNQVAGLLSPYEKEEVFFVVAVVAVVSQISTLPCQNHFVESHSKKCISVRSSSSPPQNNPLFRPNVLGTSQHTDKVLQPVGEIEPSIRLNSPYSGKCDDCDGQSQFLLMVPLIKYLNSPSHEVVIKACEGIIILVGLHPDQEELCDSVKNSHQDLVVAIVEKLGYFYEKIPDDIDTVEVEIQPVAWGLSSYDPDERYFIGKEQLREFLGWLAYFDSVSNNCGVSVNAFLASQFRNEFLEKCIEKDVVECLYPCKLVLLSKLARHLESKTLLNELADWLTEINASKRPNNVLLSIIENATESVDLTIETLALLETFIDRPNEKILNFMLFSYLDKRSYLSHSDLPKLDVAAVDVKKSKLLAPDNIIKVINDFLLLLPKQILGSSEGTCYEDYVQDASGHYKTWIEKMKVVNWPLNAVVSENQSNACDTPKSSDDSGISEEAVQFDEGPLLKMLFSYIRGLYRQPYEVNLAVIAVTSKLAFLPHPFLHELLLNPELAFGPNVNSLWSTLNEIAADILNKLPLLEDFQQRLVAASQRLLGGQGEVPR